MDEQLIRDLTTLVKACNGLYIVTHDFTRVLTALFRIAKATDRYCHTWSVTQGIRKTFKDDEKTSPCGLAQALQYVQGAPEKGIIVLENPHPQMSEPAFAVECQMLLDTMRKGAEMQKCVVIISPVVELGPILEKSIYVYHVPLPGRPELTAAFTSMAEHNKIPMPKDPKTRGTLIQQAVEAGRGLSMAEAVTAFGLAFVQLKSLNEGAVGVIRSAKEEAIRQTGLLGVVKADVSFDDIAGMENIKEETRAVREILLHPDEARRYHCENRKGFVFLGPPGTCKSVACKAIAHEIGAPLLRLDMSMVMNQPYIGVAENRIREALQTAKAMAPVVVQIDEMEKALSGSESSGVTDSGVTNRVIQQILTFMAEVEEPVLFVATCNGLAGVPEPLLRKGRFDEIFFIDLPEPDEREVIWRIHLRKREVTIDDAALADFVKKTDRFSGAEIEAVVRDAIKDAFIVRKPVSADVLSRRIERTHTVAERDAKKLTALRELANNVAVPARVKAGADGSGHAVHDEARRRVV